MSNEINCRYVRVVKETDSKSVGLCLRRFESCCRRFYLFFVFFIPKKSNYYRSFLLVFVKTNILTIFQNKNVQNAKQPLGIWENGTFCFESTSALHYQSELTQFIHGDLSLLTPNILPQNPPHKTENKLSHFNQLRSHTVRSTGQPRTYCERPSPKHRSHPSRASSQTGTKIRPDKHPHRRVQNPLAPHQIRPLSHPKGASTARSVRPRSPSILRRSIRIPTGLVYLRHHGPSPIEEWDGGRY